ncbi:tripartite-type tricarboxylate transporter receptor subunit TctC [Polaromonas sp. CG_9.5]|uniref:Bug family tripartite tricarboxylate transporter substrate binding protein n=1 Tax=Polaromonas sp. CG_9.5 TaxID=3071705 RepID=UPI002E0106B2|nr:tripartite-type tricarboxylate transporter receptor subunit TctC [Polaromonas sp. CG_9.5]
MTNKVIFSRRKIIAASAVTALTMATFSAQAAQWPDKVVRMVVAFPAGGPTDTIARLIAQKLSSRLGQQVIVENKPGASGSIGTDALIKSPADGYTISMFGMPALIAPIIYKNNLYDSRKDFTCVSTVYDLPYVIVINPEKLPGVENLQQLIAVAKTKDINYSSPGTGSIGHLSMEQLKDLGGFKMEHIPYKGSAPAITDLLGGQISVMYADLIAAMPHIQSGRLKAIALGSPDAKTFLPAVKSISEQGFKGFKSSSWSGLIVPNGTPAAVITRLDTELKRILSEKDTKDRIEKVGALAVYQSPEKMKARLVAEYTRWNKVATEKSIFAQ